MKTIGLIAVCVACIFLAVNWYLRKRRYRKEFTAAALKLAREDLKEHMGALMSGLGDTRVSRSDPRWKMTSQKPQELSLEECARQNMLIRNELTKNFPASLQLLRGGIGKGYDSVREKRAKLESKRQKFTRNTHHKPVPPVEGFR